MTTIVGGGDTGAVASWRLWVVPLAAGIFAGAAAFEVLPFAVRRIGLAAAAWGIGGLLVFIAIHKGPMRSATTVRRGPRRSACGCTPSSRGW